MSRFGSPAELMQLAVADTGAKMVRSAGFPAPDAAYNQPVRARGEGKRLLELSVAEAGPALIKAGLVTAEELDRMLAEMRRATVDESILAVMPRMTQVWAQKPASDE